MRLLSVILMVAVFSMTGLFVVQADPEPPLELRIKTDEAITWDEVELYQWYCCFGLEHLTKLPDPFGSGAFAGQPAMP